MNPRKRTDSHKKISTSVPTTTKLQAKRSISQHTKKAKTLHLFHSFTSLHCFLQKEADDAEFFALVFGSLLKNWSGDNLSTKFTSLCHQTIYYIISSSSISHPLCFFDFVLLCRFLKYTLLFSDKS